MEPSPRRKPRGKLRGRKEKEKTYLGIPLGFGMPIELTKTTTKKQNQFNKGGSIGAKR